jgi:predicted permease
MEYHILLAGLLIFFACLFLHVIIWRWKYPRNRPTALLLIFIVLPSVFVVGYVVLEQLCIVPDTADIIPFTGIDWLAVYLLHFALSVAYILSYPAVEAASPSLALLLMLGDFKLQGILHDDLLHVFNDKIVLEPRIQDLVDSGLIAGSDGYFKVTTQGTVFINCFIFLRRLLGLPIGKG